MDQIQILFFYLRLLDLDSLSDIPVLDLTYGYQTPGKTVQQDPRLPALQNIPIDKSVNKNKIYGNILFQLAFISFSIIVLLC